jgi:hypothetical protein
VNVSAQTVDLLGGLTSVPMTATGEHELALAAIAAGIPPCSEVVLPDRAKNNLIAGDYILEDEMNAPCRRLMMARALVDPSKGTFACRLLNPTDTPIKLREGTPLGALEPVTPKAAIEGGQSGKTAGGNEPTGRVAAVGAAPTIETMRKDLEAKDISLSDTAMQGVELDHSMKIWILWRRQQPSCPEPTSCDTESRQAIARPYGSERIGSHRKIWRKPHCKLNKC